ncbi:YqeG family HAD IIIA-type phosphatase [Bacillus cereus]|uniref:YqeG family HAD IIIA-type phosphatase n=1 Tax=Bacillus cereus group TaxID=86661 RepID=UPI00159BA944|nr:MULTISPECIES: YqeG family HAD IIIA-type phosphatase [Bacillus cereus group]
MNYFKPDFYFEHFSNISVDWLKKNNIKLILSDIDSTLAPHNEMGDEHLNKWLDELKKEDIEVVCVSNNTEKRARDFGEHHNLVALGKCKKPKTKKVEQFIEQKGIKKENIVLIGDQVFTDIWFGKRLFVRTILVMPIGNYQPVWIKAKRILENKMLKNWKLK